MFTGFLNSSNSFFVQQFKARIKIRESINVILTVSRRITSFFFNL